jgi:hypothetical protein
MTPTFEITEGKYHTLWNFDQFGLPSYINLYSSHPYFVENRGGQVHAVYWHNSNGQDWILQVRSCARHAMNSSQHTVPW